MSSSFVYSVCLRLSPKQQKIMADIIKIVPVLTCLAAIFTSPDKSTWPLQYFENERRQIAFSWISGMCLTSPDGPYMQFHVRKMLNFIYFFIFFKKDYFKILLMCTNKKVRVDKATKSAPKICIFWYLSDVEWALWYPNIFTVSVKVTGLCFVIITKQCYSACAPQLISF